VRRQEEHTVTGVPLDTPGIADGASEGHPVGLSVLVMGATGYVGSHLLQPLANAGYRVRAAARDPRRLHLPPGVEPVAADVRDAPLVRTALEGVDTAFYLVHTLGSGADYAEHDRAAARIFAQAARDAGVRRIVYLGGLGQDQAALSEHLASRHEVGRLLAESGVPVVEFRASIVIGSGSTSFEMIRNLTEKLPVMTTPRWVRMPAQPISVDDVVAYLVAAVGADLPAGESHRIYGIGGADIVTYGDLLSLYARRRGLKRLIIPVPVLSPGLSGWWLYLFTPKQATVGRQLAESLRYPTVVRDDAAARDFPAIVPIGADEAFQRALAAEDTDFDSILWAEEFAGTSDPQQIEREGRYIDSRVILAHCPIEAAFDPVACIGGDNGWYAFDTLWDLRGFIDVLLGGPGRRRGRRDQYALVEGDHLEWWLVERVVPPTLLRLRAEMRLPGRGWLQYELAAVGDETRIRQTATFDARGVLGRLYWYAVAPLHTFVFNGTLRGIESRARALAEGPNSCPLPDDRTRRDAKRRR
jgi:uncharacterized protein YbjT (DUF2867 family)